VRSLPLLALAAIAGAAACDRGATADGKGPRGGGAVDSRRSNEQADFDRERRPDVVVEVAELRPGERVADVGAGTGLLTVHIARAVAPDGRVTATDVDAVVLDLLGARLRDAGLDDLVVRRTVAPDDPGLEPDRYDAILLAQVDHYFDNPVAWLRAAMPALRPGGRIVISNRIHHRAGAMAAAESAGLALVRESTEIPGQYVAVFTPPGDRP
jgi:precorrin-6B methylase 2